MKLKWSPIGDRYKTHYNTNIIAGDHHGKQTTGKRKWHNSKPTGEKHP